MPSRRSSVPVPEGAERIVLKPPRTHPGQTLILKTLLETTVRFVVVAAGRRFGKTKLGALLCILLAAAGKKCWWVAPTYGVAVIGWRMVRAVAQKVPGADIRDGDFSVEFPNGGFVRCKSAKDPDNLRGEGLDFVVFDEAAFIKERAWTEVIRPALADRQGKALFISTPKGRNWFWHVYQRGLDAVQPLWKTFHFPTTANPFIPPSEIDDARASMPELIFLQEHMAQFLDDTNGVFRFVAEQAVAEYQEEAVPGHRYVFGVDWGKLNDFTVIVVLDACCRRVVRVERFNMIDYAVQTGRLRALYDLFEPEVVAPEANSIGVPIIESLMRPEKREQPDVAYVRIAVRGSQTFMLRRDGHLDTLTVVDPDRLPYPLREVRHGRVLAFEVDPRADQVWREGEYRDGLPIEPFMTTASSKVEAIEALQLAYERREIETINDPIYLGELQAFESERAGSGMLRYSAPEGMHDDCVMATAIAWWAYRSTPEVRVRSLSA